MAKKPQSERAKAYREALARYRAQRVCQKHGAAQRYAHEPYRCGCPVPARSA